MPPAGALVEAARFRSLGQFRLRGLPVPVSLYQVNAKGLAARFPPPRAESAGAGGTVTLR